MALIDAGGGGGTTSYLSPVIKAALTSIPQLVAKVAANPATRTLITTHPNTTSAMTILSSIAPHVTPAPAPTAPSQGGLGVGFNAGASTAPVATPVSAAVDPWQAVEDRTHSIQQAQAQAANTAYANVAPSSGGLGVGFDPGSYTAPVAPPAANPWDRIEDRTHAVQEGQAAGANNAYFNPPIVGGTNSGTTTGSGTGGVGFAGTGGTSFTAPPPIGSPAPAHTGGSTSPASQPPITSHPLYQQVFGASHEGTYNAYGQRVPQGVNHGTLEDVISGPGVLNHVQYGPELTGLSGFGGTITPNGTPVVMSNWQRQQFDPTSLASYGDYAKSIAGWNPDDLSQYSQRITGNGGDLTRPSNWAPISVSPSPSGG